MRIELNAGGLGGVSIASCQASLNKFSSSAQSVCNGFNTVQKALNNVTGGMNGTLQTVSGYVGQRIKQESQKIQNVAETTKQTICFLNDTISTDKRVANIVNKNNSNFYKVNPHLKPNKTSFLGGLFKNVCRLLDKGRKALDFLKSLPKKIIEFGVKCFKSAAKILSENVHKLLEFGKRALDYMVDTVKKVWKSIWDFLTTDGVFDIISGVLSAGWGTAKIVLAILGTVASGGSLGAAGVLAIISGALSIDSGFNNIMTGIEKLVRKDNPDFEIPDALRTYVSPISYGLGSIIDGLIGDGAGDTGVNFIKLGVDLASGIASQDPVTLLGVLGEIVTSGAGFINDQFLNDAKGDGWIGLKYVLDAISHIGDFMDLLEFIKK